MNRKLREYFFVMWNTVLDRPGAQGKFYAHDSAEAQAILQEKYSTQTIITLLDVEEAARPPSPKLKGYVAIVWKKNSEEPGVHETIYAHGYKEVEALLEEKYGTETLVSITDVEAASRPR